VIFIVPVEAELHSTLVTRPEIEIADGCVMVTLFVAVHKLASVITTVYKPAFNPVAVEVVCTGDEFHE
jgi:hypothetical protein